jgi:ubiquinone/menaquinone biosynthesis C-methylase UbiE
MEEVVPVSAHEQSPIDLTSEHLNEMSRSFWDSAILRAGLKLGIFDLLEDNRLTSDEVSRRVSSNPRYVQAFLDACVALGLLDKLDDRFTNSRQASEFLIRGKQGYVGDLVLHITNHWESWGRLDQLIKDGKTALPFESGYVDAATYWTDYMMGQHNRATAGQGYYLVQSVDLTGRRKMLDLGGGAASYSIALCEANPSLHSVVLDQKEPLEIARGLVNEQGLQDRISLLEGDFFGTDLGADSDVALISGVVLIKSEEECRRLFKLAYDALAPGGMVIVQDFMRVDHSPERSFMDTLMDMYVLIAFDPGAGDRFGDEYASWLQDAGFLNPRMIPLPTHLALVTAEKPGPH